MKKFMYALALIGLVSGMSMVKATTQMAVNSSVAYGNEEDGNEEDGNEEDGNEEDGNEEDGN